MDRKENLHSTTPHDSRQPHRTASPEALKTIFPNNVRKCLSHPNPLGTLPSRLQRVKGLRCVHCDGTRCRTIGKCCNGILLDTPSDLRVFDDIVRSQPRRCRSGLLERRAFPSSVQAVH